MNVHNLKGKAGGSYIMKFKINEKGQAVAGKTQLIDKKAFDKIEGTQIRWLGNAVL